MDKIFYTADGIPVSVTGKRIRTLRLVVRKDGSVCCSAPLFYPEYKIRAFIEEKSAWIRKSLSKYSVLKQFASNYKDGEPFYFFGEKYTLRISKEGKSGLVLSGKNAVLTCGDEREREKVVKKWYKKMLVSAAEEEIEKYSRLTGLYPSSVCVRDMKTRWGTCNVKSGKITLAVGLAKVPWDLFSYVVLHEILHLRVPDHGKEFKALLDCYMPDWRERNKRLKNHSPY